MTLTIFGGDLLFSLPLTLVSYSLSKVVVRLAEPAASRCRAMICRNPSVSIALAEVQPFQPPNIEISLPPVFFSSGFK